MSCLFKHLDAAIFSVDSFVVFVLDNFETAIRRINKKKGYIVAYSFVKGAYEEAARAKNQDGIEIILRSVEELIAGKIEDSSSPVLKS